MTAADRRLIAIEVAQELAKQNDEVLSMNDIKKMFGVETNEAVYAKIAAGLPARKKQGIGYYFLKSEIINFLKS